MSLRFTVRQLARRPVFALSAIASIALGIGVNTTIFSLANGILLRPPPVEQPEEIVRLYFNQHSPFRYEWYRFIKERNEVFTHVIAETLRPVSMAAGGEGERIHVAIVSGDYFPATRLRPALGRFFADDGREQPAAVPQVVLSHAFWTSRFGADPSIVARTIRLNDRPFSVSGVTPEGFTTAQVLWAPDVYVSIGDTPSLLGRGPEVLSGSLYLSARLRQGVTRERADAAVGLLFARFAEADAELPERSTWRVAEARGATQEVRAPVAAASGFLLAIAILVLGVACSNVGNLILARNATRSRDLAVRAALGARRGRIAGLLLSEVALLAAAGAGLALLASGFTAELLARLIPPEAGIRLDTSADGRVLSFTFALVGLTVLAAGLVPALQATRADLVSGLRGGAAGGSRGPRMRRLFLGVQVALTTVLLACASLFLRSLQASGTAEVGFETAGILDARLDLGEARTTEETVAFLSQVERRARAIPGVTEVASASIVPLTGENSETRMFVEGDADERGRSTYLASVGAGYFDVLGIDLVAGREFAETDRIGTTSVAIVNETLAERLWPGESAMGRRLSLEGASGPWLEVVGVARNIRYHTLGETPPIFLYLPLAQEPRRNVALHLRVAPGAPAAGIERQVVLALRDLDPALPPPPVRSMEEEQRIVLLPARVGAALTGAFGSLALLLAGVGIFGVAAFDVAQRTREIGIRTALGASGRVLVLGVLSDTLKSVTIGGVVGLLLALGLGGLLSTQLYGIAAVDPLAIVGTPLVLTLVAAAAAAAPARRATRVNPAVALRAD